jgi:hypothetical protein
MAQERVWGAFFSGASMRKKVRYRILRWSILAGLTAMLLAAAMFLFLRGVIPFSESGKTNRTTLNKVHCREGEAPSVLIRERRRCDISEILNDPGTDSSDYLLTRDTHYFLVTSPSFPGFRLNMLDLSFIRSFRQPTSVVMPSDERWRLYSLPLQVRSRKVEVMVGILEKAPSTFVEVPVTPEIDHMLEEEASRVASRVGVREGQLHVAGVNTKVDTWEIADGETGKVIKWIENALGRLPAEVEVRQGLSLYRESGDLFLVKTDANDDLVAVTLSHMINLWAFEGALGMIFVAVGALVYMVGVTQFRRFFLLIGGRRLSLAEARRMGEGQCVEFKRDSDHPDSILKAITAFANTNDGTVFVGIGDDGRIEGIRATSLEERDKFYQRILNGVREKIRPVPVIDIASEESDGTVVAKIFVPRGEEPLYSLGGRFYIRRAVESVAAESEDITRLMEQYAW